MPPAVTEDVIMGYTRFKGPVYGAKSLLWAFGPYTQTGSSGASTVLHTANANMVVPNYEDWFITEVRLQTSTNSTVASAKTLLVVLFFMHVWYSTRLTWVVVLSGLFFLAIMLGLTLTDYMSRPWMRF